MATIENITAANGTKRNLPQNALQGVSLLELGLVAAAGYVVYKNRDKIQSVLSRYGVDLASLVPEQFAGLLSVAQNVVGKGSQSRSIQ